MRSHCLIHWLGVCVYKFSIVKYKLDINISILSKYKINKKKYLWTQQLDLLWYLYFGGPFWYLNLTVKLILNFLVLKFGLHTNTMT